MVYFMNMWGKDGVALISEDKSVYVYVKEIKINVPIETIINESIINDKKNLSGSIRFETKNEIVIKEKIAYIN
jgi:hypothetical protein